MRIPEAAYGALSDQYSRVNYRSQRIHFATVRDALMSCTVTPFFRFPSEARAWRIGAIKATYHTKCCLAYKCVRTHRVAQHAYNPRILLPVWYLQYQRLTTILFRVYCIVWLVERSENDRIAVDTLEARCLLFGCLRRARLVPVAIWRGKFAVLPSCLLYVHMSI